MNCHEPESTPTPQTPPATARGRPLVALVGNPNTGKTALFNRLTGQNARVGNYPGITVDRRVGALRLAGRQPAQQPELLDVPGAYSLSARSNEEQIAIDALLGINGNPRPDLAVIVLDATQLGRNLYMALQILELGIPAVLALNMIDEAGDDPPDHRSISALLGVPCVPTSAREGIGIQQLKAAIADALANPPRGIVHLDYPAALDADVARVIEVFPADWQAIGANDRALALWALTSIDLEDELSGIDPALRARVLAVQADAAAAERDLDAQVITTRYSFLDSHRDSLFRPPPPRNLTERVDRVLLHPIWGFTVFVAVMLAVFQALFSWADPAISLIESGVGLLSRLATHLLPPGILADLVIDGVIGGVGNVIVFLPQILLLFLFIGLLEDSGYMARAAYLMDRVMRALGLHGRAFVPMLSGYACAVPAIMATRTMERERDRVLTMLVVPLMTCSARLPVYTLIIAAMFPPTHYFGVVPVQGLLMMAMYAFGTLIALFAAGVLGRTVLKGKRVPLILELPPYRLPTLSSTGRLMWERARVFLTEAGTVILVCTVIMWGMLTFPRLGPADGGLAAPPPADPAAWQAQQLEYSFAGRIGRFIEPVIEPLGFDWKLGVGIVGSFAAREVFVSTMGVVYGVGSNADEETAPLRDRMRAESRPDGKPAYPPLVGLSLLVFYALAMQCMSTLAIVKRETRGWKWPVFLLGYMTALAWVSSFLVYQVGRLLGLAG